MLKKILMGIALLLIVLIFFKITQQEQPEQNSIYCQEACSGNKRCIILCENSDIINKATAEDNLNICEQLNKDAKNVCIDQVYLTRAIKQNNIEICNSLLEEDFKPVCFDMYYLEKSKQDLSLCTKIIDPEIKEFCEAENE